MPSLTATPNRAQRQAATRSAAKARARLLEDLQRLCDDAGITVEALARAAGVPASYLRRIMAAEALPSLETYAKLGIPLGADLAARLYPNTGPLIRDRHQARIVEALLGSLDRRWHVQTEVAVRQPARGWIDVVLRDEHPPRIVAVEIESDIRRIEQQVRWARMKAESLPSSDAWPADGTTPQIERLLIVRRTRDSVRTFEAFEGQLRVAYPAHPEDALASLTGSGPWPGHALIWAELGNRTTRLIPSR